MTAMKKMTTREKLRMVDCKQAKPLTLACLVELGNRIKRGIQ